MLVFEEVQRREDLEVQGWALVARLCMQDAVCWGKLGESLDFWARKRARRGAPVLTSGWVIQVKVCQETSLHLVRIAWEMEEHFQLIEAEKEMW